MSPRKLTKQVVDALTVLPREYVAWCAQLSGFGCRVRPSGAKTFVAQYRVGGRNTPTRKVTIGAYGKLTVEEARAAATTVLAKAELGEDVAAERARKRAQLTVSELCDEYLDEGCELKKPSTVLTDRSRINRHIKPLLGRRHVGDLARADIERFMRDVANGKTAVDEKVGGRVRSIVTGGKGAATRTVRLLGGILSYAVNRGYIASNPRRGVKLYADAKGERFLSDQEFRRLGDALHEAETIGLPWRDRPGRKAKHRARPENRRELISPAVIAAIRLLMITGCRLGEILTLRWSDVDLERGVLNLRDSKTGRKRVLLSRSAVGLLTELPRFGDYVVAGADPCKPRPDIKRPWSRIVERAQLGDFRLHDLRHSYASVGAASGLSLATVGKLLGHTSPETTARYAHLADDPLRRASEMISETISAATARMRTESIPA